MWLHITGSRIFIPSYKADRMIKRKQYNRIQSVIDDLQVSQQELADLISVHVKSVSRWCTNETQPSLKTIHAIADKLAIDVRELIAPNQYSAARIK
jgi:transcriptional regulator with XRE-family HTH domain